MIVKANTSIPDVRADWWKAQCRLRWNRRQASLFFAFESTTIIGGGFMNIICKIKEKNAERKLKKQKDK